MKQNYFLKVSLFFLGLITLLWFNISCFGYQESYPPPDLAGVHNVPLSGSLEVIFSPNGGCSNEIINTIHEAQISILIQAYEFTSRDIANALVDAERAGINVQILLDKSNENDKYSVMPILIKGGIPGRIDYKPIISHNKIMIIDNKTVITGSYNYTVAAERQNTENLLIFRNNKELANLYTRNWLWRWKESGPQ